MTKINTYLLVFLLAFTSINSTQAAMYRHYVVVQAFKSAELAESYVKEIKTKGYNATLVHNPERGFYYVCIEESDSLKTAAKEKEIARTSGFENAWVYSK